MPKVKLTQSDYNAIPGWNWSKLRAGLQSMAHLKHAMDNPREDTPALALGRLVHLAILEPEEFHRVAIAPQCDRRTKEGKAAWLDFLLFSEGRETATQEDHDMAGNIAMAAFNHPGASAVLRECLDHELPIIARAILPSGREIALKGRADAVSLDRGHIADFKTSRGDVRLPHFAWDARKFGYFHQMAFYRFLFQTEAGLPKMSIVAIESAPPHGIMVYELDPATLDAAWAEIERLLDRVLDCVESGNWPGYPGEILSLSSDIKPAGGDD